MKTIHVETELPADADAVWRAMQHPSSFTYVIRPLMAVPALAGRTEPFRQGESGTGWLFLLHVVPMWRHTIELVEVGAETRTLRSRERGGVLRAWNHVLHVEPAGPGRSRYSDTVEIDAGPLTPVAAAIATGFYRYRQRRWRRLARRHLAPTS